MDFDRKYTDKEARGENGFTKILQKEQLIIILQTICLLDFAVNRLGLII